MILGGLSGVSAPRLVRARRVQPRRRLRQHLEAPPSPLPRARRPQGPRLAITPHEPDGDERRRAPAAPGGDNASAAALAAAVRKAEATGRRSARRAFASRPTTHNELPARTRGWSASRTCTSWTTGWTAAPPRGYVFDMEALRRAWCDGRSRGPRARVRAARRGAREFSQPARGASSTSLGRVPHAGDLRVYKRCRRATALPSVACAPRPLGVLNSRARAAAWCARRAVRGRPGAPAAARDARPWTQPAPWLIPRSDTAPGLCSPRVTGLAAQASVARNLEVQARRSRG
jgi:hypothetical protein